MSIDKIVIHMSNLKVGSKISALPKINIAESGENSFEISQ